MANPTLAMWGPIQFQIWPLNIHEMQHFTGSDFAKKEVMESSIQREWVGEKDEELAFKGRIFPLAIGGFANLESMEAARKAGQSHLLVRGGAGVGQVMGWFVCEDLRRDHQHLATNGIGKVITFDIRFARVDPPWSPGYYPQVFEMIQST